MTDVATRQIHLSWVSTCIREGDVERNFGSRIAGSDHQHRPRRQLGRAAVVTGVILDDLRIKVVCDVRNEGVLVRAGCNDDVATTPATLIRPLDQETRTLTADDVDLNPSSRGRWKCFA
jgi:hypothetical protein